MASSNPLMIGVLSHLRWNVLDSPTIVKGVELEDIYCTQSLSLEVPICGDTCYSIVVDDIKGVVTVGHLLTVIHDFYLQEPNKDIHQTLQDNDEDCPATPDLLLAKCPTVGHLLNMDKAWVKDFYCEDGLVRLVLGSKL